MNLYVTIFNRNTFVQRKIYVWKCEEFFIQIVPKMIIGLSASISFEIAN